MSELAKFVHDKAALSLRRDALIEKFIVHFQQGVASKLKPHEQDSVADIASEFRLHLLATDLKCVERIKNKNEPARYFFSAGVYKAVDFRAKKKREARLALETIKAKVTKTDFRSIEESAKIIFGIQTLDGVAITLCTLVLGCTQRAASRFLGWNDSRRKRASEEIKRVKDQLNVR